MRKKNIKYGSFKIFINGEFLMKVRCSYEDVLDLMWPVHFDDPLAVIEIVADVD